MASYCVLKSVPAGVERLAAVTLQGLVNRSGPRLYLLADEETDGHWVQWYRRYDLAGEVLNWPEVLEKFAGEINGALLIGERDAEIEIPLAVTLAGVEGCMLVTSAQAQAVRSRGIDVKPLPIAKFGSRLEAMRWAIDELRPRTDPLLLQCNHGHNVDIVDLVVARKGFSFGLTTNPVARPGERDLLGELYRASPAYAWLLGWFGGDEEECTYIDYASRHGIVPFCTIRNLNFSFHRHVQAKDPFKQNPMGPLPEPASDKAYVAFVFSDGDAPHSMADLQKRQWKLPQRGRFPFGWAIPPQMAVFGPAMLEYYYKTLTEQDELLCGPSGLGYNYLSCWATLREDADNCPRTEYLRRTGEFFDKLDLHAAWPINRVVEWLADGRLLRKVGTPGVWMIHGKQREVSEANARRYGFDFMDEEVIADYCTHLPRSLGFFQGWHKIPDQHERVVNNRPYFPAKVLAETPAQTVADIEWIVRYENARLPERKTPCFIPVHVNCYSMGLAGAEETISLLDRERFEVVAPTVLLRLAAAAQE